VGLGTDATVPATFLAPNGTIVLGHRTTLMGALVGKDVLVDNDSTLNFESGLCVPEDCDNGNPCTEDTCDIGTCIHINLEAGTPCADNDLCNGDEACDGSGTCAPGIPPVVDDGNPCTEDSCDPACGVSHPPLPAGTECSDGNPDNGMETCDGAGTCVEAEIIVDVTPEWTASSPGNTPFMHVAWTSPTTLLAATGFDVYSVNTAGTKTLLFDGTETTRPVLNPSGIGNSVRSGDAIAFYDNTGANVGTVSPTDRAYIKPIPSSHNVMWADRVLTGVEELRVTDGFVIGPNGEVQNALSIEDLEFCRITETDIFWVMRDVLIKTSLNNVEAWRLSIDLHSFEVSEDGNHVIGKLIEKRKVAHVAGGVAGEPIELGDAIWDVAISPSGEHSSAITKSALYIFQSGELIGTVPLEVAYAITTDISDAGEALVGAKMADNTSRMLFFKKSGETLWESTHSLVDKSAWRPHVQVAPDNNSFVVRTGQDITFYSIERQYGGAL
jgi:hypothetical protein